MNTALESVLRLNASPRGLIVAEYAGAALFLVGGAWLMWATLSAASPIAWTSAFGLIVAGMGLGSDAKARSSVNDVLNQVRSAADI